MKNYKTQKIKMNVSISVLRKTIILFILGFCTVFSAHGQQVDSLTLTYGSFGKLFKTYKSDGKVIAKDSFRELINSNEKSSSTYQKGRITKLSSGLTGVVSLGAFLYFTKQWIDDDILVDPPLGYYASLFGVIGANMLHLRGKNTVQIAINEYNGSPASYDNPFRLTLNTGYPIYGIFNLIDKDTKISQQRSVGVGMEAYLFQEHFGFVDVYRQSSVTDFGYTSSGRMLWQENGYTVMSGIGSNYRLTPNLEITTKLGLGVTSINRKVFFGDKLFKEEKDERVLATQLGLGIRYFAMPNLGIGANANLATSTPLLGFEIIANL